MQYTMTTLPGGDGPRVLVAEDDGALRAVLARCLQAAGLRVTTAVDGLDALKHADSTFGLLVTDLQMPGLDGRSLAERLRATRPELGILYLSGAEKLAFPLPERAEFLPKPFGLKAFKAAVDRLLAG